MFEKLKDTLDKQIYEKLINNQVLSEEEIIIVATEFIDIKCINEALLFIKENEDRISKRYYEFTQIKIDALIIAQKLDEAKRVVLNELEVPYIPDEFEKYLKDALKDIKLCESLKTPRFTLESFENLDKFNVNEILLALPHINNYNLNPHCDKFQILFQREDIPAIIKSYILAALSDNKLNHNFLIFKNNKYFRVNPSTIKDLRDYESFIYAHGFIDKHSHKIDGTNYETLKELLQVCLLHFYPEELNTLQTKCLIFAIVKYLNEVRPDSNILKQDFLDFYPENNVEINKYYETLYTILKNI